jgi:hypothetical protein
MVCSAAGSVADDDTLLSGVGDVDVVQSGSGPAHDAKIDGGVEEALVDEGLAAHDDAVVAGDGGQHLFVAETVLHVHLAGGGQLGDGFVVHQLGH